MADFTNKGWLLARPTPIQNSSYTRLTPTLHRQKLSQTTPNQSQDTPTRVTYQSNTRNMPSKIVSNRPTPVPRRPTPVLYPFYNRPTPRPTPFRTPKNALGRPSTNSH